ncbi:retrotransposon protein, putative, ty1-copia subclass [Tanacetum coccineum]|uniref:Retrotransposon protein, putative, ty1-copia subclass n=1 Tax=Tanacetum coccineum TaxID=301880 RepID=A0ABQ5ITU1_9ASTR
MVIRLCFNRIDLPSIDFNGVLMLPQTGAYRQRRSFSLFLGSIPDQSVELLQLRPSTPVIDIFDHTVPHKIGGDQFFKIGYNGKTVGSKWLFKKKTDMDEAVHTYKAHLMENGYTQTLGIDHDETFSPIADIRAIRILIAIAAYYDYEIWQMDVKAAFLNGYLSKQVYMEQPEGFLNPKYPKSVCKLKRFIYGLKQASRQWNK